MRIDLIKTKLAIIDENIKLVEENLPKKLSEFESLGLVKDGIYKRVEASIQEILSVCAIINADLELRVPSNRDDIINALEEKKVISDEIINVVRDLKGFRRFLIHRYGPIDDEIAFRDIKEGLSDFEAFKEEILRLIKEHEP